MDDGKKWYAIIAPGESGRSLVAYSDKAEAEARLAYCGYEYPAIYAGAHIIELTEQPA